MTDRPPPTRLPGPGIGPQVDRDSRWRFEIATILVLIIIAISGFGVVSSIRAELTALSARVTHLELTSALDSTSLLAMEHKAQRLEADETAIEACRQRTEHLRAVLEVLIPSGIWPERVRLPNPPPGWSSWPELGRRDQPD